MSLLDVEEMVDCPVEGDFVRKYKCETCEYCEEVYGDSVECKADEGDEDDEEE